MNGPKSELPEWAKEVEKNFTRQEELLKQIIVEIINKEKGQTLKESEKSPFNIINVYVNELRTIQILRGRVLDKCNENIECPKSISK